MILNTSNSIENYQLHNESMSLIFFRTQKS